MSEPVNTDRRNFFKFTLLGFWTGLISPYLINRSPFAFGAPTITPLKDSDPTASALGYNVNADQVDTKKWTKKAAADGKLQMCNSCIFYTSINKNEGKCQIFPNNTVAAKGWCNSWNKKPS